MNRPLSHLAGSVERGSPLVSVFDLGVVQAEAANDPGGVLDAEVHDLLRARLLVLALFIVVSSASVGP